MHNPSIDERGQCLIEKRIDDTIFCNINLEQALDDVCRVIPHHTVPDKDGGLTDFLTTAFFDYGISDLEHLMLGALNPTVDQAGQIVRAVMAYELRHMNQHAGGKSLECDFYSGVAAARLHLSPYLIMRFMKRHLSGGDPLTQSSCLHRLDAFMSGYMNPRDA